MAYYRRFLALASSNGAFYPSQPFPATSHRDRGRHRTPVVAGLHVAAESVVKADIERYSRDIKGP